MLTTTLLGASSNPPAGGAAISDVIYATADAMVATILLLGPILLYSRAASRCSAAWLASPSGSPNCPVGPRCRGPSSE